MRRRAHKRLGAVITNRAVRAAARFDRGLPLESCGRTIPPDPTRPANAQRHPRASARSSLASAEAQPSIRVRFIGEQPLPFPRPNVALPGGSPSGAHGRCCQPASCRSDKLRSLRPPSFEPRSRRRAAPLRAPSTSLGVRAVVPQSFSGASPLRLDSLRSVSLDREISCRSQWPLVGWRRAVPLSTPARTWPPWLLRTGRCDR